MICVTRTTRCGSLNFPVNITLYPSQWCYHETWSQCCHTRVTICAIYQRPLSSVKLQEECQGQNCTVLLGTSFSTVHVLPVKSIECSAASRYLSLLYKLNGGKNIDTATSSKLKTFIFWRAMFYMYKFLYSEG